MSSVVSDITSNHPETNGSSVQPVFNKVGEDLYRLELTGGYYALVKRGGKQIRRSLKTKNRKLAERRLAELRKSVENLSLSVDSNASFFDIAAKWLDSIKHTIKASTFKRMVGVSGKSMPRMVRGEYPGAIYYTMSRGDRRENIFHDEMDRQDFLETLAEACLKVDFQVRAFRSRPSPSDCTWEAPRVPEHDCESPKRRKSGGEKGNPTQRRKRTYIKRTDDTTRRRVIFPNCRRIRPAKNPIEMSKLQARIHPMEEGVIR
ncbi:MAG: hypothetical protein O2960_13790 [Verrucomicrobia bacterium]|nr:hypothetical protein [Verrucomicrobiota bacterium]